MNYFEEFLGQQTAFYNRMKKVARALNFAVIFQDESRQGSGFNVVETHPIILNTYDNKEEFIAKKYITLPESSIEKNPGNCLWSHLRWKKREEKPN